MTQRFDRLPPEAGLFMQVWAESFLSDLETALDDIETNIADILAAQTTATASARELARINSYPSPTNVLTAADVGADATITIAAHTRVYPVQGSIDVADVSVAGGSLTGKSFSTLYYIYYDDATLASTTPTYVATTSAPSSRAGAAAGRHFVGEITTPANGAGGTSGSGGAPPGGGAIP